MRAVALYLSVRHDRGILVNIAILVTFTLKIHGQPPNMWKFHFLAYGKKNKMLVM